MFSRQRQARHKMASQLHLDTRVSQRLGIHFNRSKTKELIDIIQSGQGGESWQSRPSRYWYRLEYDYHRYAWFLYDKALKRIITCYRDEEVPADVMEYERARMYEEAI